MLSEGPESDELEALLAPLRRTRRLKEQRKEIVVPPVALAGMDVQVGREVSSAGEGAATSVMISSITETEVESGLAEFIGDAPYFHCAMWPTCSFPVLPLPPALPPTTKVPPGDPPIIGKAIDKLVPITTSSATSGTFPAPAPLLTLPQSPPPPPSTPTARTAPAAPAPRAAELVAEVSVRSARARSAGAPPEPPALAEGEAGGSGRGGGAREAETASHEVTRATGYEGDNTSTRRSHRHHQHRPHRHRRSHGRSAEPAPASGRPSESTSLSLTFDSDSLCTALLFSSFPPFAFLCLALRVPCICWAIMNCHSGLPLQYRAPAARARATRSIVPTASLRPLLVAAPPANQFQKQPQIGRSTLCPFTFPCLPLRNHTTLPSFCPPPCCTHVATALRWPALRKPLHPLRHLAPQLRPPRFPPVLASLTDRSVVLRDPSRRRSSLPRSRCPCSASRRAASLLRHPNQSSHPRARGVSLHRRRQWSTWAQQPLLQVQPHVRLHLCPESLTQLLRRRKDLQASPP